VDDEAAVGEWGGSTPGVEAFGGGLLCINIIIGGGLGVDGWTLVPPGRRRWATSLSLDGDRMLRVDGERLLDLDRLDEVEMGCTGSAAVADRYIPTIETIQDTKIK